MTIKLRPHHLLCMLTFIGKGYTPSFVSNFEQIAGRIAAGDEVIEIVSAPDDICKALLAEGECHCHNSSVLVRDQLAAEAIGHLLQQPIPTETRILLGDAQLQALRRSFAAGAVRQACDGCPWKTTCDAVAAEGFSKSKLQMISKK